MESLGKIVQTFENGLYKVTTHKNLKVNVMSNEKCIIFLLSNFLLSFAANSQINDLQLLAGHHHRDTTYKIQSSTNEYKLLFSLLFVGYKKFISPQDYQRCSFKPSCSEYGILSIYKKGIFAGILGTFDRITRCHSLAPENYEFDPEIKLLLDPVD